MSVLSAKVKSVLSGDTIVLTPPNKPDQERNLSLAYVAAPRLAGGEAYGFESREYLRTLLVGKPVRFRVFYDINGREYGDISAPIFQSLIEKTLQDGTCKLRDDASNKSGYEELGPQLEKAQDQAQKANKGCWSDKIRPIDVQSLAPEDPNQQYDAVVERVIAGDRLQLRAILQKTSHFVGQVLIAGIKAPRSASPDGSTPAEPFGEQSKTFVAARLLQRNVGVKFLSRSSSGVPIVQVVHPAGDIAQLLLTNGLASIADWQSQVLGAAKMSGLRASEKQAKESKLNLWKDSKTPVGGKTKTYDAVIAKIVSPDTMVVRTPAGEETVQLASVRAPRKNDPAQAPYVNAAKEFARSKFIAKKVLVTVEATRPASEQFPERALVTITHQDKNIALPIIQNGWATVIRHRKDDDDRSPIWDELMELEQAATKGNKGIFSKKAPPVDRVVEASENLTKAKGFLPSLERLGKINAVVEHVPSGGRLRITVPSKNCNLAMVLSGVRVPKTSEECGDIALEYVSQRLYQRDVHITVQNVDKTGAFIGHVYLPGKNIPLSIALVKEGLAEVHDISAQHSGYEDQLIDAEEEAKAAKRGIWKNYQPQEEQPQVTATTQEDSQAARKYLDAKITDISPSAAVSYRLKTSEPQYTKLQSELTSFNNAATNAALFKFQTGPKRGELVTVNENGVFSRAKVIGIDKPKVIVQYLDTGKTSTVASTSLRPLPQQFKSTPALAKSAELSFVESPPAQYLDEYVEYLEAQLLNKDIVINVDNAGPPESVSVYTAKSKGPTDTFNAVIVDQGYAFVKPQLSAWEKASSWKPMLDALTELEQEAKADRVGVWEYGDPRNID